MDPLAQCQEDLFYRLLSRKQLKAAGVMVQLMKPRAEGNAMSIIDRINIILAGQVTGGSRKGLALLLPLPAFEPKSPNVPSVMGDVILKVIILENIMVNGDTDGTGLSCEGAALLVALAGHHFILADNRRLIFNGMTPLKVEAEDFQADIAYEVSFKVATGFRHEDECQQPMLAITGEPGFEELTFTSATSGATVWMTLDGSLPCEQNPAAVPVTGPLPVLPATGTTVRAVAVRDDLNPSSPAYLVIP